MYAYKVHMNIYALWSNIAPDRNKDVLACVGGSFSWRLKDVQRSARQIEKTGRTQCQDGILMFDVGLSTSAHALSAFGVRPLSAEG